MRPRRQERCSIYILRFASFESRSNRVINCRTFFDVQWLLLLLFCLLIRRRRRRCLSRCLLIIILIVGVHQPRGHLKKKHTQYGKSRCFRISVVFENIFKSDRTNSCRSIDFNINRDDRRPTAGRSDAGLREGGPGRRAGGNAL